MRKRVKKKRNDSDLILLGCEFTVAGLLRERFGFGRDCRQTFRTNVLDDRGD